MGLFGPGKPNADNTAAARAARQSNTKLADANASTRPNTVTMAELQRRAGR